MELGNTEFNLASKVKDGVLEINDKLITDAGGLKTLLDTLKNK